MILKYVKEDLFKVDEKYYLAHCISADYKLGAGIAVEFNKRYDMSSKLKECKSDLFPSCIYIDGVFNLITKEKYWNKPTYGTLRKSLEIARDMMINFYKEDEIKIEYLAIPKIGCGLDRLNWIKVEEIIKDVFTDMDIEILVCSL